MESSPHTAPPPGDELLPTRPSLLARLRNHDDSKSWHRGWEEFYLSYHPVLYRHALKHGLSDADAADVVQEIVIGLARSLPQYQYAPARSSFKTWLFRVAHNKVVDQLRKLKRQRRGRVENDGNENREAQTEVADENALTPDRAWDLTWETNLRRAALDHVKNRVKPMTMRLYLHHVVDGHSVAETVHCFGDSQVAADAVHLAKHRVQKMMDEALARLREGESLE